MAGAAPAHAAQAADVLAYADSRGIPSHGANRADTYANEIEAKLVDGKLRFRQQEVLRGVSWDAQTGQRVGLVGQQRRWQDDAAARAR